MTNVSTYQYLKFVPLKDFYIWDYETYFRPLGVNHHYPLVKLSEVLTHRNEYITIDEEQEYKRCKVQLYGRGIVLRDIAKGKDIKVKRQQVCKADEILVAEIDAKVGGYGLLPKDLEGAIVSSHYFLFQIDFEQVDKEYLDIYLKTDEFFKQVKSTGSTNYAAIRPYHFLDYKIALPPKDVQRKLVNAYQSAMNEAAEAASHADEIECSIENYLLDELGIEIVRNEIKKGLQFVPFKELERWDYDFLLGDSNKFYERLEKAKFKLRKLGSIYDLVTRGWRSQKHKEETFNYIEIGSIDEKVGITEVSKLKVEEAPHRATQTVSKNDLLISLTRPYLKKFVIVEEENDGDVCSSGFQVIQPSNDYSLLFLLEFLRSEAGIKQFEFFMTGALYPAITSVQLRNILIPLPPLPIQERIVAEINAKREQIKLLRETVKAKREQAKADFENALFENNF